MASLEEKRNIRSAMTMIAISIGIILFLFFIGIPVIGRFTSFLNNIRSTGGKAEDKTPPAPPKFNNFSEHTNKKTVDISGKSEAGATIVLTFNGSKKENITNKNGEFSFNLNLNEGKNNLSAVAKDTSGNLSNQTNEYQIFFDDKAPKLELSKPDDGANLFGTAQRQITIEGVTDTDAQVTINDRFVTVESTGNFQYSITLNEGENKFNVKAVDQAGNATEKALTLNFTP